MTDDINDYPEDTGSGMDGSLGDVPETDTNSIPDDITLEEAKALDLEQNKSEQPDTKDSNSDENNIDNTGSDGDANPDDPTVDDTTNPDNNDNSNSDKEDNQVKDGEEQPNAKDSDPEEKDNETLDAISLDDETLNGRLPVLKAVGKEIPIDNIGELYNLASKGIKFTQNMQTIKPHYNVVSAMIDKGYTNEDMFLAMEALEGNKEAFAEFVKRSNVEDLVDVEEAMEKGNDYKAVNRGTGLDEQEIESISSTIVADEKYGDIVKTNLNSKIPSEFRDAITADAESLNLFYEHTKDGTFDKAKPIADKLSLMNPGMEYQDAYIQAAKQVLATDNKSSSEPAVQKDTKTIEQVKKTITKETEINDKRRAAGSTTTQSSGKDESNTGAIDFENMDIDSKEFDEMYKKMMAGS